MRDLFTRKVITTIVIVAVLGIAVFVVVGLLNKTPEPAAPQPIVVTENLSPKHEVIGKSMQGRNIDAYTYGNGATRLLLVGGMHGGYEWNAVLLAYQFMDYFATNTSAIPANLSVTVIPSLNPDGVFAVIGKEGRFTLADVPTKTLPAGTGRFNADGVDLNRNFDCNWKPTSTWQTETVSAGTAPFSEPEAAALRDFVLANNPIAVVFWHSASGSVYASECNKGILPTTLDIMNAYAHAAGYSAVKSFDSYAITGDSEGWLASINIPALTVELQTHNTVEWDKNLAGVKALLGYYGK